VDHTLLEIDLYRFDIDPLRKTDRPKHRCGFEIAKMNLSDVGLVLMSQLRLEKYLVGRHHDIHVIRIHSGNRELYIERPITFEQLDRGNRNDFRLGSDPVVQLVRVGRTRLRKLERTLADTALNSFGFCEDGIVIIQNNQIGGLRLSFRVSPRWSVKFRIAKHFSDVCG